METKTPTLEEVLNQEVGYYFTDGTRRCECPKYGIVPLDLKDRMSTSLLRLKAGQTYTANWYRSNVPIKDRSIDYGFNAAHDYSTKFVVAGNGAALLGAREHNRMIYPLMTHRLHFKLAVVRILGEESSNYGRGDSGADIRCNSFEVVKVYDELDSKVSLVDYLDSRNDKIRDGRFWKDMSMVGVRNYSMDVNFFMEPLFFERYKKRLTRATADGIKIKQARYKAQPDTPDYKEADYWYSTMVVGNKYYLPPEV